MIALLVDIGNSRIKWRIEDLHDAAAPAVDGAVAITDLGSLEQHWQAQSVRSIDAVFTSNVARADLEATVTNTVSHVWGDVPVDHARPQPFQCGVVNGYRDPSQLGVDRWLAIIGARMLEPDRSVLVCSFGTATTIDLLIDDARQATFVGGLILPGIETMHRALARGTARLQGPAGRIVDFADETADAISGGIMAAQIGAVERVTRGARARLAADDRPLTCILAGGDAAAVEPLLANLDTPRRVVPDLVLRGLAEAARDTRAPGRRGPTALAAHC